MTTTDWRFLCRPISSIPAVLQLPAGKSELAKRSSPGSPRWEEGGKLRDCGATIARRERVSWEENRTVVETFVWGTVRDIAGLSAREARTPNLQSSLYLRRELLLGICNYGGLIDTLFTDVEGVA